MRCFPRLQNIAAFYAPHIYHPKGHCEWISLCPMCAPACRQPSHSCLILRRKPSSYVERSGYSRLHSQDLGGGGNAEGVERQGILPLCRDRWALNSHGLGISAVIIEYELGNVGGSATL